MYGARVQDYNNPTEIPGVINTGIVRILRVNTIVILGKIINIQGIEVIKIIPGIPKEVVVLITNLAITVMVDVSNVKMLDTLLKIVQLF
jgi:hypothetical protein